MGYYTSYFLEVHNIKNAKEHEALRKAVENLERFGEDEYDLYESEAYFFPLDEFKWYEHEQDMLILSKLFPNLTFCLEGHGEDAEDMWRKYFHSGIVELCPGSISYPSPTKIHWDA